MMTTSVSPCSPQPMVSILLRHWRVHPPSPSLALPFFPSFPLSSCKAAPASHLAPRAAFGPPHGLWDWESAQAPNVLVQHIRILGRL